ncbi:MFS transporter [Propionibacterium freudenreichii]|uniref:MFS transporter n=1 Tax=Propionibacterium freudenreichii TaxID=1744 RepID=UPI00248615BB|nr:MFS transporter [Propionibacterium freudenreichii]MDK9660933.1 MFS transporter [Propionibacterium freudenreichii]WGU90130.1 MFS transporter [Propionibacterium freudenreichii]
MAQLVPAAPVPVGVPTSGGDVGSGSAPGVRARPRLVLFGLILAVSMTTIDQTIVSLTAPTIARSLGLSASGIEWAINAYLLAAAALFQLGGRLSDVFGYRRMVIVASALFLAGSIVCGLVPGGSAAAGVLIAGRAVQGAGMAAMFPSAVGLLFVTVPAGGRASSMAKFFSITGAMTALGPILGSWLAPINWRLIFFVNVPLGLAALVVLMVAHVPRTRRPARIDLAGAALSGAGMFLLVFALQKIGAWGWGDLRVWTLVALGVAALVAFVATQRRAREPLLDLRVFADRAFCLATAAIAFSSMAFMAVFYFLSVYGQLSLNLPVLHSSELLFWFFLGFVLAARLGARRFDRAGLRSVLIIGGLLGAAGFGAVAARAGTIGAGGRRPHGAAHRRRRRSRLYVQRRVHRHGQPLDRQLLRRGECAHPDHEEPRRCAVAGGAHLAGVESVGDQPRRRLRQFRWHERTGPSGGRCAGQCHQRIGQQPIGRRARPHRAADRHRPAAGLCRRGELGVHRDGRLHGRARGAGPVLSAGRPPGPGCARGAGRWERAFGTGQ